jgi:hypothetical protein
MSAATFRDKDTTFRISEFVFVDTAFGGVNRRNNVKRLDTVRLNGLSDCYVSHNRATDALVTWVQEHRNESGNPTVAGFDGPTWAGNLHIDLDCAADPGQALEWLRKVLGWLEAVGVDLRSVRACFSGYKGFSLEIPHTLFGGFTPSKEFPKRLRRAAKRILGDIPFDTSVYDTLRLWRLENSQNAKSGLYKIRLTIAEARTLTIDEIRALAAQPRDTTVVPELTPVADDEWLAVDELVGIWSDTIADDESDAADRGESRPPTDDARDQLTRSAIATSWPRGGQNTAEGMDGKGDVSRHADYLMPILGFLIRRTSADHARSIVESAAELAGDQTFLTRRDWRNEIKRIADGANDRLRGSGDGKVRGLPSLKEHFPGLASVLDVLWPALTFELDFEEIVVGADGSDGPGPSTQNAHTTQSGAADMSWPEPERRLDLPAAPALDLSLFPPEVANVALDAAERLQCPPDYVAWGLTVCLAGLIGRGVGVRPRQFDDWTERACLWVALVGPPSWMKSPALDVARRPLKRQDAIDHERHEYEMAAWEAECDAIRAAAKKGEKPKLPPKPIEVRRVTSDGTIEKLADLMAPSPGLTLIRDEIAGWVGAFNRYTRAEGDRQFFLECYSGGPYTVDRINRGTVRVPDTFLNILGGAQPDRARDIFGEGPDDGFAARVTAVYPDLPPTWKEVDRWPDRAARDALDGVCDRLATADWPALLPSDDWRPLPYCRLDREAGTLWSEWHTSVMVALRTGRWEGRHAGRVGKYPGLAARLVLAWHLVGWAAGRIADDALARVPALTMASVLDLMDGYVRPMDDRVYRAFDRTAAATGAERIARWVLSTRPESFTLRDVRRHEWSGLTDPVAVSAAVEWLAAKGWIREADPEQRPGRPANRYLVNPRVWEVIA